MTKTKRERYTTIRLPLEIEQELRKRAEQETRSLSSQVLHYIKLGLFLNRRNNVKG